MTTDIQASGSQSEGRPKVSGLRRVTVQVTRRLIRLLLLGLLSATILGVLADRWWLAELFLDTRWHIMVAAVVASILLAILRCPKLAAISFLLAVGCAIPLQPWSFLFASTPIVSNTTKPLRAMFWNVYVGNQDAEAIMELIEPLDVDVVVLLEYSNGLSSQMEPMRQMYPFHREIPSAGAFGLAVFSRVAGEFEVEWLDENTPTICLHLTDPNFSDTDLWAVHVFPPMNHQGWNQRNRQIENRADFIVKNEIVESDSVGELHDDSKQRKVIVGGDFNCVSWATPVQNLLARANLKDSSHSYMHQPTWPTALGTLGIPIDQVLHSPSVNVVDRQVHVLGQASDHAAVVVEVVGE